MSFEDNQARATIRHILTGCWVDLTLVNVRVNKGNVYISGSLLRMTQEHREFNASHLKHIDLTIRSLGGIRGIYYNLDNWACNVYGTWEALKG